MVEMSGQSARLGQGKLEEKRWDRKDRTSGMDAPFDVAGRLLICCAAKFAVYWCEYG